jgi:hypothetical protein
MVDYNTYSKYSSRLEKQMFKIGRMSLGFASAAKHAERAGSDYSFITATARMLNRIGSYQGSKALSVYRDLEYNIKDTESYLESWENYDSNPASQKLVGKVSDLHRELVYMKKLVDETPPEVMDQIKTNLSTKKCFIATAVYGDEDAHEVQVLRHFRDNVLHESGLGRKVIELYYSGAGEKTANFIKQHMAYVIPTARKGLDIVVRNYEKKI